MTAYRYPLTVQTVLPDDFETNGEFRGRLSLPAELGVMLIVEATNRYEAAVANSLGRYRGRYVSVHFSDNNRLFPGFGGRIGLEAQVRDSFESDIRASMRRFAPILE